MNRCSLIDSKSVAMPLACALTEAYGIINVGLEEWKQSKQSAAWVSAFAKGRGGLADGIVDAHGERQANQVRFSLALSNRRLTARSSQPS